MNGKALGATDPDPPYRVDEQIGFLLRQVAQRHAAIFTAGMDNAITATQWAALSKLREVGPLSQNLLGRLTVMDGATVKGVIDRLTHRGFTATSRDPATRVAASSSLTPAGAAFVARMVPLAFQITRDTLAPLDETERRQLAALLQKLR